MMKKSQIWQLDGQGNLDFQLRSRQLRDTYLPENFWEKSAVSLATLIFAAVFDAISYLQIFSQILYDNFWIRVFSVTGALIVCDLGAVYLGLCRKRSTQGLKTDNISCALVLAAFIAVSAFNIYLRITLRDLLVPSSSAGNRSVFSSLGGVIDSHPAAMSYAVFSSLLPIGTSVVSYFVSIYTFNPLKDRLKRLHIQQVELEGAAGKLDAILAEYQAAEELKTRLTDEDDALYRSALTTLKEQGVYLADYVRERLKEHIGTEEACNLLSGDFRSAFDELCRPLPQEPAAMVNTIHLKEVV